MGKELSYGKFSRMSASSSKADINHIFAENIG